MYDICYYVQAHVKRPLAPKESMNFATTSDDTTPQPPWQLSSLTAFNNGLPATDQLWCSFWPMMKFSMPPTDSSMKPTVTKAPSCGATSFEADLHHHCDKRLHVITMKHSQDISTIQHCGQGKPLIKCGPHFKGNATTKNYMAKTPKSSKQSPPSEWYATNCKWSEKQLTIPTTPKLTANTCSQLPKSWSGQNAT